MDSTIDEYDEEDVYSEEFDWNMNEYYDFNKQLIMTYIIHQIN